MGFRITGLANLGFLSLLPLRVLTEDVATHAKHHDCGWGAMHHHDCLSELLHPKVLQWDHN